MQNFARYEQAPGSHTEREEGSQKEAGKTQMSREPAYWGYFSQVYSRVADRGCDFHWEAWKPFAVCKKHASDITYDEQYGHHTVKNRGAHDRVGGADRANTEMGKTAKGSVF